MTDYSALTDKELDKLVAERLGWRIEQLTVHAGLSWHQVFTPDGTPILRETAYGTKNAWPLYELDTTYPAYSTDANAALALIKSIFRLETGRAAGDRVIWRANAALDEAFWVTADTPARAIVLAWLAWQDAQSA